jgi:hypothetical protein
LEEYAMMTTVYSLNFKINKLTVAMSLAAQ